MEERIIVLETAVAFQEAKIAELSDFLDKQQIQTQTLEAHIERIVAQLQLVSEGNSAPPNERPPHH